VEPLVIDRVLSEYLVGAGVRQLAVSETQKFGHVTCFWNGNRSGYLDKATECYIKAPSDRVSFDEHRPRARARPRAVAQAVLVGQGAAERMADDLDVAVAVSAKAHARRDAVLVDDTPGAHSHVEGVMVVSEQKAVKALEPAVVGMAAVGRSADGQHGRSPFRHTPTLNSAARLSVARR